MKSLSLIAIIVFISLNSIAQIHSDNGTKGFVLCNDITLKGNKLYVCGSYSGNATICNNQTIGLKFTSPFISISDKLNSESTLIFPVKSVTGYAEFNNIYSFNNSIYISGIFTRGILVKGELIEAQMGWDAFIIKLDNNDSIEWFKIFNSNNNNSSPEISYLNEKLYIGNNIGKEDSMFNKIYELNPDGSLNWELTFNNHLNQKFAGLKINHDTIISYSMTNGQLIASKVLGGEKIGQECNSDISGYNLSSNVNNKIPVWVNKVNSGNISMCKVSFWDQKWDNFNLLQADFLITVDIIDVDDSFIYLAGFYQGQLYIDSSTFTESDSSNSFFIKFNYKTKSIANFSLLPFRNIFKAVLLDSIVYYVSNYVDGSDNIERSASLGALTNNDFKVNATPLIKNDKIVVENAEEHLNLIVYPNSNLGKIINICCNDKLQVISFTNSLGQDINFKIKGNSTILTIELNEDVASGIYFLKVKNNDKEQIFRIIKN